MSEKDSFGDKIRNLEKAQEDQWARQRDQELIEKMRHKAAAGLTCPRCKKPLAERLEAGVTLFACPDGEGAWLDAEALKAALTNR